MKPFSAVFQLTAAIVLLTLLTIFMIWPLTSHHGSGVNMITARFRYPHPEADRDDALITVVTHDGKVYFGPEQINPDDLAEHIRAARVRHDQVLFIKADQRARYARVESLIDAAQAAGVREVAFLAEQRRSPN